MRVFFKTLLWAACLLGLVAGALYALMFDVWSVPTDDPMLSASIAPTLSPGDVVVLSRHGSVSRGELLRCNDPQAAGRYVIARAIGASGDKLVLDGETVSIDGHRTPSPHACDVVKTVLHDPNTDEDVELVCSIEQSGPVEFEALRAAVRPEPLTKATVEGGSWYLVSDDRHLHVDSRDYGPIDPRTCEHVLFRIVGPAGFGDVATRFSIVW